MGEAYDGIRVQLVDGVHDNQGTVALLALNCNVLLVSDACGQLLIVVLCWPHCEQVAQSASGAKSARQFHGSQHQFASVSLG